MCLGHVVWTRLSCAGERPESVHADCYAGLGPTFDNSPGVVTTKRRFLPTLLAISIQQRIHLPCLHRRNYKYQ